MKVTIVGCGDAFGSGGRLQSSYHVQVGPTRFLIDCGATALIGLSRLGIDPNGITTIFISHLHGDHFGGLPFLLLDAQFLARRERPLLIAGPPGTRLRLDELLEVFFPLSSLNKWRFPWKVVELEAGSSSEFLGHSVSTVEVVHFSGAPSTALRISDGEKVFAYSGDTEWVDALPSISAAADLFIVECYKYSGHPSGHLTWQVLKSHLKDLRARRIMLTHMNPTMLERLEEIRADGMLTAEDGAVLEF